VEQALEHNKYYGTWAPERFFGHETKESEVFTYGVVLWEMLTLSPEPRFYYPDGKELSCDNLVYFILLGGSLLLPSEEQKYSTSCAEYIKLIKKCWNYNPKERPTFDQIIEILTEMNEFNEIFLVQESEPEQKGNVGYKTKTSNILLEES